MRTQLRRRPSVEALESISLLSAAAAVVPHATALVAAAAATPTSHTVHLTGTATGTYRVRSANPDAGKTFSFLGGPSQISPLGTVVLTGSIQSPGFIANAQSQGQLVLHGFGGSVTLQVTGPPQNGNTPVPDVFNYSITKATGRFRGDTGSGYIDLTLTPSSATTSAAVQGGRFSMKFLTAAPPTTPSA